MYKIQIVFNAKEKELLENFYKSNRQYKRLEHLKRLILDGIALHQKQE